MILHGIEYQRPTSLNMRILADHVTYSFLAFMKSIFHFCLGCYCGGYSQNGRSNLSSFAWSAPSHYIKQCCVTFNWTLRNKPGWNLIQNTKFFINENASENIVCKMTAILSRARWVKMKVPWPFWAWEFHLNFLLALIANGNVCLISHAALYW